MVMKIQKMDVVVPVLAGLSCLFFFMPNPVTVWAVFIGWAWYFNLGAEPQAFVKAIPPMILGYILSAIAVVSVYAGGDAWVTVLAVVVAITVFVIMVSLKIPAFAASLVSFNSYAIMFGGYFGQAGFGFPFIAPSAGLSIGNIVIIALWMMMSNLIGMGFGFLSIALSKSGK